MVEKMNECLRIKKVFDMDCKEVFDFIVYNASDDQLNQLLAECMYWVLDEEEDYAKGWPPGSISSEEDKRYEYTAHIPDFVNDAFTMASIEKNPDYHLPMLKRDFHQINFIKQYIRYLGLMSILKSEDQLDENGLDEKSDFDAILEASNKANGKEEFLYWMFQLPPKWKCRAMLLAYRVACW